jgi:anti-sigma regulatory factor (Ser/Thr protein kinase)
MEEGLVDIIHSMKRENQTVTAEGLYQKVLNYSVSKTFDDDISAVIFASQPIELVPKDNSGIALPSLHEIALSAEHLKQPDVLQRVLQIAGQCEGIQNVRSILYTVISELFNNALEHGVLLLDSKLKSTSEGFHTYYQLREKLLNQLSDASITITIEALPNQHKIRITVKDSGRGFSWDNLKSVNDDESYGRGLALVQAMCEQMWFEDKGSKVICTIDTKGTP